MNFEKLLIGVRNALWVLLVALLVTTVTGCSERKLEAGVHLLAPGEYKVGVDIPHGEYLAITNKKFEVTKLQSEEDSQGNMTVDTLFRNVPEGVDKHTFWACDGESIRTDTDIELQVVTKVAHT